MVISMDRWKGKVAVVTGASSGIGRAIAKSLVEEGLQVVALARREDRLKDLQKELESKPGKLYPLRTDITVEEDILQAFKWTQQNLGPVHILVNNAGITKKGTIIDGDTEIWTTVMNTNVMGLAIATREAIKSMRDNNIDGHVIHINSIAGHKVTPLTKTNMYSASKFAVTAITETLRQELIALNSKIRVTSISPGCVESEIFEVAGFSDFLTKMKEEGRYLRSGDIADAVVYVLSTPPHVQVHELIIKPVGEYI